MSRKALSAAGVVAAALLAWSPAGAQTTDSSGTVKINPNVGVDANVGTGSQSTSGSTQTGTTGTDSSVSGNASGSVTTDSPAASPKMDDPDKEGAKARGLDPEKKTGLDRADEAAGSHGQHGRDNAREKQDRK